MYGTIARLRVKPGAEAMFVGVWRALEAFRPAGHVATYVYRMDANANEYYLAVIFTSKEAYQANADSPEMEARFQEIMATLAEEPEWHDGEIVSKSA